MKRALPYLLIISGVLLMLWLARAVYFAQPRKSSMASSQVRALSLKKPESSATPPVSPERGGDSFKKWGLAVSPEAAPYLERAIRCAEVAEIQKRRLSPGNRVQLLDGIQQKLFMDDYIHAALTTGLLNPELAQYAFGKVAEQLQYQETVAPPQAALTPAPPLDQKSAGKFREHYDRFFASTNSGYAQILNTLTNSTASDVLATDLFKDACLYVGLQTQLKDWREREEIDNREILQKELENISNPAELALSTNSLMNLMQEDALQWDELESAYRSIFAFRFRDRHGLDSGTLIPKLEKLELKNSGPELRIPE